MVNKAEEIADVQAMKLKTVDGAYLEKEDVRLFVILMCVRNLDKLKKAEKWKDSILFIRNINEHKRTEQHRYCSCCYVQSSHP